MAWNWPVSCGNIRSAPPSSTSQITPVSRWTAFPPIRWNTCSSRWTRGGWLPPWTGTGSGRQDRKKRPVLRVGGRAVPLDEIAYLETAGRKTAVHTREERIEYTVPLSKLKEEFQKQGFCLSHFSYLVNLAHVARVERDALTLDTGESIPVSRRYYQDFMARYVESLK